MRFLLGSTAFLVLFLSPTTVLSDGFARSCENIWVGKGPKDYSLLFADCGDGHGTTIHNEVDLNHCLGNQDGHLVVSTNFVPHQINIQMAEVAFQGQLADL